MRFSTGTFTAEVGLRERIQALVDRGVSEIELSGGSYESDWENSLSSFPDVKFSIHNYFPPPQVPFVFNLASQDADILKISREFCLQGIRISSELEEELFSLHAGFLFDPTPESLGKVLVGRSKSGSKKTSEEIFEESLTFLINAASRQGVSLLVENNVLTRQNMENWGRDALMWTHAEEIKHWLISKFDGDLGLLLDVGHLKVSSKTLGLDFAAELGALAHLAKGMHVHGNDGEYDSHSAPIFDSTIWGLIDSSPAKYLTYEVNPAQVRETIDMVMSK